MSLATAIATDVKPRRRQSAKAPKNSDGKPVKASLYLSAESSKRLGIHSTMEGRSQSAIVEELIREHLRRWVVSDRAKPSGEANIDGRATMVEGSAGDPE